MIIITGKGSVESRQGGDAPGRVRLPREAAQDRPPAGADPQGVEKYQVKEANRAAPGAARQPDRFGDLIGQSEEMRQIYGMIEAAAPSNASMLIVGESGTGKELVARAIHDKSHRARRARSSPSTARPSRARSSRTSSSATRRAPSPARSTRSPAASSWPTAARSSSTRSPRWSPTSR
jgi:hypothetical protein